MYIFEILSNSRNLCEEILGKLILILIYVNHLKL